MINENEPTTVSTQRGVWSRFWTVGIALIVVIAAGLFVACSVVVQPESDEAGAAATAVDESGSDAAAADAAPADATAESDSAGGDSSGGDSVEVAETGDDAEAPTELPGISAAKSFPPATGSHKGIPAGFTEEGYPYRGEPDAPIILYEFSDFQCPFCNRYFVQTEPALDEAYVRSGNVRVVFRDLPLAQLHPNAPAAHVSARCVADQGNAEQYWDLRGRLFRSVGEWGNMNVADAQEVFAREAEAVGVDMAAYTACVEDNETWNRIQDAVMLAENLGFNGTPSFLFVRPEDGFTYPFVGAQPYDEFAGLLDALLAGETPRSPEEQQQEASSGEAPLWARAEGWAPDEARPGYNVAGDQYRGNLDAEVLVVEFSDFQCPYCRSHVLQTQPILDEKYVETGLVAWVFKHFPLTIHPQAPAAGVAAECAAEQGQFWEMHDVLFEEPEQWSIADPNPVFEEYAARLGLDGGAFSACLQDEAMMERVTSDLNAGAQYVQGTPAFFVFYKGEYLGTIPGALPEERFSSILDQVLAGEISAE